MKRILKMLCAISITMLAGCASVGTGTAASDPSAAQWSLYPAFQELGMQMTANAPASVTGPMEVVLTTTQDVDIRATYVNTSMPNTTMTKTPAHQGSEWRVELDFPTSGTYQVTLMGKPKSAADNAFTPMATAQFTAKIDAAGSIKTYPGFSRYGLAFVAEPKADAQDESEFAISIQKDFSLAFGFVNTISGKSATDAVDIGHDPKELRVSIAFPETGDYVLTLYGKPKDDTANDYETLTVVRFHASVDQTKAVVLPTNWTAGPGFRKYGVTITQAPDKTVKDFAQMLFTTSKAISLATSYRNNTTGKDSSKLPDMVDTSTDGTKNGIDAYFPENGEYDLWIWGKASEDKDYLQIARVAFSATATDRSGVLPANWVVNPRFWRYGLGVKSSPAREVGDSLKMLLDLPAGLKLTASLKNKTTGNFVYTIASDAVGSTEQINALFPKSGEYELVISGRIEPDKYGRDIARVSFVATVDDSVPHYRLWGSNGAWPEVMLTKVETVTTSWKPRGRWSEEDTHLKGVLSADLSVPVGDISVPLRKGTVIEFAKAEGQPVLNTIAFALPKDFPQKIGETTVTFKAGSTFAVESYGIAGVVARDTKVSLEGGELSCPKGSRLVIDGTDLSEIALNGKGVYTFNKKAYECTDSVNVESNCGSDAPCEVRILTSKIAPMQFGSTKFALPAGSLISFTKTGIDHVVLSEDFELVVNGQKEKIPAGWAARFDDKGMMEKFQAE